MASKASCNSSTQLVAMHIRSCHLGEIIIIYVCMYNSHNQLVTYTNIGTVIEGPSDVTYLPGVTPLPIELTCNVTGVAAWRVNGTSYTLASLTNGALPGHNRTGTNILVNNPVNNTEYICASTTNDGETSSDPAYIIIAGEYFRLALHILNINYVCIYLHNEFTGTMTTIQAVRI